MKINNEEVKKVISFKYLGSVLDSGRKSYCEIEKIISEGIKVIDMLNSGLWSKYCE